MAYTRLMLAALLVISLFAGGCGDDEAESTSPTFDAGCTDAYPSRVAVQPPEYEALGRVCGTEDATALTLANVSQKVLRVWNPQGAAPATLTIETPQADDPGTVAALEAVPATCGAAVAECVAPPGAIVTAAGAQPVTLRFAVLPAHTITANAARGLASWAAGKLQSRGTSLARRAVGCATDAGSLADDSPYISDAMRTALSSYQSCKGFVDDVLREVQPNSSTAAASEDVLSVTRKLAGGSFNDELVFTAIKILPRR